MKKFIVVTAIAAGLSSPAVVAQTQEPPKEQQQPSTQQMQQPSTPPANKQTPAQTDKKPQDNKARQTETNKQPSTKQTETKPAEKKQQKSTETKPSNQQPKSTEKAPAQPQQKQTDTKPSPQQPQQTQNQPADKKGKVELSADQRTKVEQEVRKQNIKSVSKVNVKIEIGSRIPRSVRLYAMPAALVTLVPAYRTYRVVVIEDEICIVDPNTYAIVEVVGGRMKSPSQETAAIELTSEERALVIREAKWDDARADVQIRLGLGAEIPTSVKVVEFGEPIVKDVPKLKGYKYVTVGQDLVVIDDRRNVVLMLTR